MEPIRILCLFTILNRGGAETMCMNLYRHIDRSKVQFDFLVYCPEKGMYDDEVERLGGHVYRIPHLKHPYAHLRGARAFFRTHPEYRIVHNHMQQNAAIICREAMRAGVPTVIYHSHAGRVRLIERSARKTARRFADVVAHGMAISNSNVFLACGEEAQGVLPARCTSHIIRNAIDLLAFDYDVEVRRVVRQNMNCSDRLVIGNVARFDDNKNQSFSVQVIDRLIKRGVDAELWLVGTGDTEERVRQQVFSLGLQGRVRFLGVRTDVSALLQAMDVFLFPSKAEGLPVACIEAQAAGLPCLLSDGIDSHTAVTDGCMFLSLSDPKDTWADKIQALSVRQRVSTLAEMRAAGYDVQETAAYMQSFYLEHCGN